MREVRQRYISPGAVSPSGDGFEPELSYNSAGELIETGKVNVYEIIQSHKEECDIQSILERAMLGDEMALHQRLGQYLDVVDAPASLLEAKQMANLSEAAFNALTPEDQAAFKEDPEKFFDSKLTQSPEVEKAALLKRLSDLTGKEVVINE